MNNEKLYRVISGTGAGSLAIGIVVMWTGIACGVMMIGNGVRLLKQKYQITI